MRSLDRPPLLDRTKHFDHQRCRDRVDRQFAYFWENVLLKGTEDKRRVPYRPGRFLAGMPFERYHFERVARARDLRCRFLPLVHRRIQPPTQFA